MADIENMISRYKEKLKSLQVQKQIGVKEYPVDELIQQTQIIIDALEHRPTKAKWIYRGKSGGHSIYECSSCHNILNGMSSYCKECGTEME